MLQIIPALLVAITVVIQCLAVQMSRYRLSRMNARPPHHGLALMSGMLAAAAIILRLYQNDSAVGVLFMTMMYDTDDPDGCCILPSSPALHHHVSDKRQRISSLAGRLADRPVQCRVLVPAVASVQAIHLLPQENRNHRPGRCFSDCRYCHLVPAGRHPLDCRNGSRRSLTLSVV